KDYTFQHRTKPSTTRIFTSICKLPSKGGNAEVEEPAIRMKESRKVETLKWTVLPTSCCDDMSIIDTSSWTAHCSSQH
ncbi:hypothetical protein K435DRAFT_782663, partial [Dendrothele bispora CBS 962.96]